MLRAVLLACIVGVLVQGGAPVMRASLSPATQARPSICFSDADRGWLAKQNRVMITANGGASWRLSLSGRFYRSSDYRATIRCAGPTAWVLFVGPGAAMNQKPYVLYHTIDGGARWTAAAEEGYFGFAYPDARARRGLGEYPGPFTVVNRKTAYFIGLDPILGPRGSVEFDGTMDSGRSWIRRTLPCISPQQRVTLRFLSPSTGWVTGTCNGQLSTLMTDNGGRTWSRHAIP